MSQNIHGHGKCKESHISQKPPIIIAGYQKF